MDGGGGRNGGREKKDRGLLPREGRMEDKEGKRDGRRVTEMHRDHEATGRKQEFDEREKRRGEGEVKIKRDRRGEGNTARRLKGVYACIVI